MEMEALKDEIKTLRTKVLNDRNFREWNHDDIIHWIMLLENNRFIHYEKVVNKTLREEQVTGQDLVNVNRDDIKAWGINKFSDIKALEKHITDLVKEEANDEENIAIQDEEGGVSGAYFR